MEIEQYDEKKMCECLRAVKSCLDGLSSEGMLYRKLKPIYDKAIGGDWLPLSYSIDWCLDTTNSSGRRNWQFNHIILQIDTLLKKMKKEVDWELMLKQNKLDGRREYCDDGEMNTALSHIQTADDLLNAAEAEMQSRKQHGVPTRALLKRLSDHVNEEPSKFEKGVEIIQTMFRACEELDKCKIDERPGSKTGLTQLLSQMGLSIGKNGIVNGQLKLVMDQPQEACELFSIWLTERSDNIFTWIENLETVLKSNEILLLFAIMDEICNFMILFGIKLPTKTWELHDRMLNRVYNIERNTLFYNFENFIGNHHILKMDYDMDKTFNEKCYFEDKYLCTVAHDVADVCTDFEVPGTKSYNINVTWPDGRIEKWKLSFFVYEDGEQKGQFLELEGQKHMLHFFFKKIIKNAKI
jgi:hypothetical protein